MRNLKQYGRPSAHVYKKSNGITFDEWMKRVTAIMVHRTGMTPDDMPDYSYRDAYEANDPPASAATDAIKNAKDSY